MLIYRNVKRWFLHAIRFITRPCQHTTRHCKHLVVNHIFQRGHPAAEGMLHLFSSGFPGFQVASLGKSSECHEVQTEWPQSARV